MWSFQRLELEMNTFKRLYIWGWKRIIRDCGYKDEFKKTTQTKASN